MNDTTTPATTDTTPNHPEDVIKEILANGSEKECIGFFRAMERGLQQACIALGELHHIEVTIASWSCAKDLDDRTLYIRKGKPVQFPSYSLLKHIDG